MGLTVDFLDMGISYEVDRMDDRPKNSNQPHPAKADLFRSEVSRVKNQRYVRSTQDGGSSRKTRFRVAPCTLFLCL